MNKVEIGKLRVNKLIEKNDLNRARTESVDF